MGKLIGLLVILAGIAGAVWFFSTQGEVEDSQKANDNKPRLEEKYGYTGQGAGG